MTSVTVHQCGGLGRGMSGLRRDRPQPRGLLGTDCHPSPYPIECGHDSLELGVPPLLLFACLLCWDVVLVPHSSKMCKFVVLEMEPRAVQAPGKRSATEPHSIFSVLWRVLLTPGLLRPSCVLQLLLATSLHPVPVDVLITRVRHSIASWIWPFSKCRAFKARGDSACASPMHCRPVPSCDGLYLASELRIISYVYDVHLYEYMCPCLYLLPSEARIRCQILWK